MSIDLTAYQGYRGFLFVGDPHVSSGRIGRRKDDYTASVLEKLERSAEICHERQLVPVCLGDLFHRNGDSEIRMLNRLTRVLKKFPVPMLTLVGNHDMGQTTLGDEDVLTLLGETGVVTLVSTGLVGLFLFEEADEPVRLWACAHGAPIPHELPPTAGTSILVTHHDLAFGGSYPGAAPLQSIAHCDMVVNGHMHDTKPTAVHGGTHWHNPGNIEPLSVDMAGHIPKVWEWLPSQGPGQLLGIALPHAAEVFDMAGLQVAAASEADVSASLPTQESSFARLLTAQSQTEAARTDDGAVLLEDLETVFGTQNASESVRRLLLGLASTVTTPTA